MGGGGGEEREKEKDKQKEEGEKGREERKLERARADSSGITHPVYYGCLATVATASANAACTAYYVARVTNL